MSQADAHSRNQTYAAPSNLTLTAPRIPLLKHSNTHPPRQPHVPLSALHVTVEP